MKLGVLILLFRMMLQGDGNREFYLSLLLRLFNLDLLEKIFELFLLIDGIAMIILADLILLLIAIVTIKHWKD